MKHVVIHGHFYQPPREDPWLEVVEAEPSAAPFHDWNERIEQECYRAVVAARIPGHEGRILRIVNTLEEMSFNFGPTLLEWMQQQAPHTYASILAADRASVTRLGHGNAMAMPYHHAILPLSTLREKITEVRWGIADFRRRFGREPEGMWLPETAADDETLDVLAGEGIRFTILAPHQLAIVPAYGGAGLYRASGGSTLAVFVYDGPISHDVAFGPLVRDAQQWVERMLAPDPDRPLRRLVSVATDGETFGHHHVFGEMALALTLDRLRQTPGVGVTNFAVDLALSPPTEEVELTGPSSWSCPHGVERWRSDCGCRIGHEHPTQQAWRGPLREALSWLAGELHAIYDRESAAYFRDPDEARLGYGAVVGDWPERSLLYVAREALPGLDARKLVRAAELLELERGALRSLTSCAWFFDDIGRIETIQVLRYAAWAIGLTGGEGPRLERGLLERLAPAMSNDRSLGSGKDIYLAKAKPTVPPQARIAAGLAVLESVGRTGATEGYVLEGANGSRTLLHRRTGQRIGCNVSIERQGLNITASVDLNGSETAHLGLDDLPERARNSADRVLRRDAVARLLPPGAQARVDAGDDLRQQVRTALLEATHALAQDRSPQAISRVRELGTLLSRLGQSVPFEVQTVFYEIWTAAGQRGIALLELARELGFDVSDSPRR